MLTKIVFKLGQHWRNPSLNRWYLFLKSTENWSYSRLEEYQLSKLKELLSFANKHSSFYRELFIKSNIEIGEIKELSDIKKLPIVTKDDLINCNEEIHSKFKFKKTFLASSSGSTGQSLKFKREEAADSFNRASTFRGYSWYKVMPWEKNGYFWGFQFTFLSRLKISVLDLIQNRFRLFTINKHDLKRFSDKLKKASYLHGYSSLIYALAKFVNKSEMNHSYSLKMVKGTSEKIFESYKEEVHKAFGVNIISEYGAAESGIIAFECPEGNMHLNMEGVFVEEVEKEIVVTNLQMKSFPIIRYKLGDYISLASKDKKCRCGLNHQIIEEVTGRVGDLVYGINENYPSLYFYYIFKNLGTKYKTFFTYQVKQLEIGKIEVYIEENLLERDRENLSNEIESYFKKDIKYKLIMNYKLTAGSEKLKSFISKIS